LQGLANRGPDNIGIKTMHVRAIYFFIS
jgi:hypothetical protein